MKKSILDIIINLTFSLSSILILLIEKIIFSIFFMCIMNFHVDPSLLKPHLLLQTSEISNLITPLKRAIYATPYKKHLCLLYAYTLR